jgi:small-conductance mechanosensitive channel
MEDNTEQTPMRPRPRSHRRLWRRTNTRLVPFILAAVVGVLLGTAFGGVRHGTLNHKLVALAGILIFVGFGIASIHVLTDTLRRIMTRHLGASRAATIQFVLRIVGYVLIGLVTLSLLNISISSLLLGGAVTGIILGVAAQQALANFFASVILLTSRTFVVGERIIVNAGGLGGKYTGVVVDMGLTHTRLQIADGTIVMLPNAALLSGAAITPLKPEKVPDSPKAS